ncbi:hypothetical protein TIFTF001_040104 [Ficus carica]|uniref:Uncharacterized protein n=1 Tax=Ficus carica TaxID=3494 RepID=A0AA87YY33_FICCA|nr:hypothetical protein TIFTF001_040104 [Ficus carica]
MDIPCSLSDTYSQTSCGANSSHFPSRGKPCVFTYSEIIALSHKTLPRASETPCTLSGSILIAQRSLLHNSTDDNREGLLESYHDGVENALGGSIDIA